MDYRNLIIKTVDLLNKNVLLCPLFRSSKNKSFIELLS